MGNSRLAALYDGSGPVLSFELFPPKTPAGERALFRHVDQLMPLRPAFITCTYGAGGSTRDKTLQIVDRVKQTYGIPVASHLTCVGATSDQLRQYLSEAQARHIDHIVALRGDPPQGQHQFQAVPGGFSHAIELVELIRSEFPGFGVAVAGYPEKHQEAPSLEVDLEHLKNKVAAGADIVITQLFYSNSDFYRFVDRCREKGIQVPIVPGILPITSLSQVQRITAMCGAKLPADLVANLEKHDDAEWQFQVGVEHAIEQVRDLIGNQVPGVHFYVLNKSQATRKVVSEIIQ